MDNLNNNLGPHTTFTSQPPQSGSKNKIMIVVVVVLAILIGIGVAYKMGYFSKKYDTNLKETSGDFIVKPNSVLPKLMPIGFPITKEEQVLENYEYTDGVIEQSTRKFVTTETPEQYYTKVMRFMSDRNWSYSSLNKVNDDYYTFNGSDSVLDVNVSINKSEEAKWQTSISFSKKIITKVESIPFDQYNKPL